MTNLQLNTIKKRLIEHAEDAKSGLHIERNISALYFALWLAEDILLDSELTFFIKELVKEAKEGLK